jgi:aminoglycoside phosphotransferase (APT) family kinase protein
MANQMRSGRLAMLSFSEDWDGLVDLERLGRWLDEQRIASGPIVAVQQIKGGTQNLLLRFERGGGSYVLRRPGGSPRPGAAEAMQREARILAALADTDVPHPRLIASCGSANVLGAPFYVMARIEGFNPALGLPHRFAEDAAARRRMGFALVEGAAAMARVDVQARCISDLGKAEGFLERQVDRWLGQLESYGRYEGWPGPNRLPGIADIAAWLAANRPPGFRPGLMHGDYHMANVLFRPERPELAAIVDWELATIGDPLIDLGWVLATWPSPDGIQMGEPTAIQPWSGFPTCGELAEHYARVSGRDLDHLRWYRIFACFKLGIMLEATYARAMAGKADRAIGLHFHNCTLALLAQGRELLDE